MALHFAQRGAITRIVTRLLTLCLLCFATLPSAFAETGVYVQNNTPFPFTVNISSTLSSQYWKKGATTIAPGKRLKIMETNRDEGVKSGKNFEFRCALRLGNQETGLRIRLKGTTFGSTMWQSVDGHPWYEDRATHQRPWSPNGNNMNIKYRAYFTGGFDDVEYIIQYRYPTSVGNSSSLHVLAYNTYMRPTALFINGQAVRAPYLKQAVMTQGYDVLILSELFDNGIRQWFRKELAPEFPYQTKVVDGNGKVSQQLSEDGGVVIFSRWPIVAQDIMLFNKSAGSDSLANKGVAYACINKQGKRYHVFGTHTQADANQAPTRRRQLIQISEWIRRKTIPASEPVLVGGDLNVDKIGSANEYKEMLTILNAHTPIYDPALSATWDPTINKCADDGTPEYLDYVFAIRGHGNLLESRNQARLLRSREEWKSLPTDKARWDLSDHFPVYGAFRYGAP